MSTLGCGSKLYLGNLFRRGQQANTVILEFGAQNLAENAAEQIAIMAVEPCLTELVGNRQACITVKKSFVTDRIENSHAEIVAFRADALQHRLPRRRNNI